MLDPIRIQTFFTALPLGFGLLHLVLYAAMPRLRSNLYYGLFLCFIAAAIFFDFQEQVDESGRWIFYLRLHRAFLALAFVFGVRFFYEAFLGQAPARFRYLAAALIGSGVLGAINPIEWFWPLQILLIVAIGDGLWCTGQAIRRRQEDVSLIAAGFIFFAAFASYDMLLDFGLIRQVGGWTNAYQFGLIGLFAATSGFLARSMARTGERLVEHERRVRDQEVEKRLLEAEVQRTRAELEEARQFQLGLRPSHVPERQGLRIAVDMATAAEVGGDYYDFLETSNGTLVCAVGDATGHGLRAGILAALTKSLFQGLRPDESLPEFFARCTRVLKPMRLGNLFMALTVVRVRQEGLTVAAAGMPPALICRSDGSLETVVLKGMPLGAFLDFDYAHTWVPFASGDTLLLMTDGIIEAFNPQREMLGLENVAAAFAAVASHPPEAIIEHLRAVERDWLHGEPLADDSTILVVQATA